MANAGLSRALRRGGELASDARRGLAIALAVVGIVVAALAFFVAYFYFFVVIDLAPAWLWLLVAATPIHIPSSQIDPLLGTAIALGVACFVKLTISAWPSRWQTAKRRISSAVAGLFYASGIVASFSLLYFTFEHSRDGCFSIGGNNRWEAPYFAVTALTSLGPNSSLMVDSPQCKEVVTVETLTSLLLLGVILASVVALANTPTSERLIMTEAAKLRQRLLLHAASPSELRRDIASLLTLNRGEDPVLKKLELPMILRSKTVRLCLRRSSSLCG